jgi:hypothetical protein
LESTSNCGGSNSLQHLLYPGVRGAHDRVKQAMTSNGRAESGADRFAVADARWPRPECHSAGLARRKILRTGCSSSPPTRPTI